ncbi:hypothetical protein BDZ97DRAFT_1914296 [Flammula alnicola]|nr:hypothetical protein BDZ97DRAFT_1914296 [Flammula alnicola]
MGRFEEGSSGLGSMVPISNDRVSSLRDSQTRISNKRACSTLDSMDPRRSRSPPRDLAISRSPPSSTCPTRLGASLTDKCDTHKTCPQPMRTKPPVAELQPELHPSLEPCLAPALVHPSHGDFVPSRGHSAQQSSFNRDMGASYGPPQRSRFPDSPYDLVLYPGVMHQQQRPPPFGHQPPISREERGDMFAAFLEADERSRQQNLGPSRPGSGGFEWPTHYGPPTHHDGAGSRGLSEGPSHPGGPDMGMVVGGQGSWLELFASGGSSAPGAAPDKSAHQGTSWERAGGTSSRDDLATIFGSNTIPKSDRQEGSGGGGGGGHGINASVDNDTQLRCELRESAGRRRSRPEAASNDRSGHVQYLIYYLFSDDNRSNDNPMMT